VLALGIDTATAATTTAVVEVTADGLRVRAERTEVDARGHGELLAPQLTAVLAAAGARPDELAAVVAGTGPGPYTGLRIGLVTAAAIGDALEIPAYPVCSLDALAATAGNGADRLLVATDARRREIYWAVYQAGARVAGPAVDRPAVVAGRLADLGVRVALGEGVHRFAGEFAGLGLDLRDRPRHPAAAALVRLAADRIRSGTPAEPLIPCYLRRPDAAQPRPAKPVLSR
jgi:tRNA threonylcarbamoyl adenosine modification protein YeaZ